MKRSIGRMTMKDKNFPTYGQPGWEDFEVNSITAGVTIYEGKKLNGKDFHCYKKYWQYEPYSEPAQVIEVGKTYLLNFYDRSGDNWEPVKILFVGKQVFVFEYQGAEHSGEIEGTEFRDVEEAE